MSTKVQNPLNAFRDDPESLFGVHPRGGTAVNTWLAGIIALVATVAVYLAFYFSPTSFMRSMLLERGPTQHACVLLSFWSIIILLTKSRKLSIQRKALKQSILPDAHSFVLSSQTADAVVERIHQVAVDPERFLLFNRILIAISNLKNLGRVSDVDEILDSVGEKDESAHETSFAILGGFLWAIPVLGFIGTVLGLSTSIATFSALLEQQQEISGIVSSLREITSGLSTAFETTLLALVLALFIQLWMTGQKKAEEEFFDQCSTYCLINIVSRIKILPYEQTREA